MIFSHWESAGDVATMRCLCTVSLLCKDSCWSLWKLLWLVLQLPLTLLVSAGKLFLLLIKQFLPGFFELKTYALLKAESSSLVAVFCSLLPWCMFSQGSRCDFFQLISLCSNLSPLKVRLLIIIAISWFRLARNSAYYTMQLIIEYFSAQLVWEICPFKAYNICSIFRYFLKSQGLRL